MIKNALVWFKTDLRIEDNETLVKAIAQSEKVIPVYCFDESHFETSVYGFKKMGSFRAQFLLETLADLDNNLTVINNEGEVYKSLTGVNYDVINDFRQNISNTKVFGIKGNVSIDLWGACPSPLCVVTVIPTVIPSYASHNNELRMATTTKVVHKKGILVEKVAYDLGAKVSTKNLLWDAQSGQVLLTETVNEYGDHYFSFSYPAYWMYEGMGAASTNIGIEGKLVKSIPYKV